jgi:hypothetical protein
MYENGGRACAHTVEGATPSEVGRLCFEALLSCRPRIHDMTKTVTERRRVMAVAYGIRPWKAVHLGSAFNWEVCITLLS